MRDVYFPGNCLVSLLTLVEGQRALEVGLVGREGMIGARLALGAATVIGARPGAGHRHRDADELQRASCASFAAARRCNARC